MLAPVGARAAAAGLHRGGNLVVSIRSEPRTFNRFASRDPITELVSLLTQAKLVRINRATSAGRAVARRALDDAPTMG